MKKNEGWQPKPNVNWPRESTLSDHTPLFYAENKDRFLRQTLIRDIQQLTGRPLVVYFASPFLRSSIRTEDVRRLAEVIAPLGSQSFDLLIETDGGETDATEAIVSYLKSCATDGFRVIVPLRAKSNGTLICLAAESILMGPTSELGPIEPSVDSVPVSILTHQDYAQKDVRLSLEASFAYKQTRSLAKSLLERGMMSEHKDHIDNTVDALCTREHYSSHGAVIDCEEAKRLKLNVEQLDEASELWRKIFLLHCFYSYDSTARDISKFFEQQTFSQSVEGDDPPLLLGEQRE